MIKSLSSSIALVLIIYVISIQLAAGLFSIAENISMNDALWWAYITSLTIGYGDIYAHTELGRAITVIFSLFWVFFILPLIIANVINKVMENREAFTHEEQEWQEMSIQAMAEKLGVNLPPPPKDY